VTAVAAIAFPTAVDDATTGSLLVGAREGPELVTTGETLALVVAARMIAVEACVGASVVDDAIDGTIWATAVSDAEVVVAGAVVVVAGAVVASVVVAGAVVASVVVAGAVVASVVVVAAVVASVVVAVE
jgi:hypothetical protein